MDCVVYKLIHTQTGIDFCMTWILYFCQAVLIAFIVFFFIWRLVKQNNSNTVENAFKYRLF